MDEASTTTTAPATTQTPPVGGAPATPPVTPPAAAAKPAAPAEGDGSPAWLPERLNQAKAAERNALLKQFGVEKPEDLQSQLKRLKDLETAQLSESERVQKELDEAKAAAARGATYEKRFADMVNGRFEKLPEDQQQRIDAKAAGDPGRRYEFMDVLGLFDASTSPPKPQPAGTAPPGTPKPPPANGSTPQTAWEKYQSLNENAATRMQASIYYTTNKLAIEASKPAG